MNVLQGIVVHVDDLTVMSRAVIYPLVVACAGQLDVPMIAVGLAVLVLVGLTNFMVQIPTCPVVIDTIQGIYQLAFGNAQANSQVILFILPVVVLVPQEPVIPVGEV